MALLAINSNIKTSNKEWFTGLSLCPRESQEADHKKIGSYLLTKLLVEQGFDQLC